MAASATLHPLSAWPFFDAARQLGLPVDDGHHLIGWEPQQGTAGPRIEHSLANDLLGWAVEQSGRRDLGLLAAELVTPGHFELVELASRTQATVGDAMATVARLAPVLHDGLQVSLERGPEIARAKVQLRRGLSLHPAGYDFVAATLVIAARRQTGREVLGLRSVELPYPRPSDAGYLEAFFETDLLFEAPTLAIACPSEALQVPLLRSDANVSRALREVAEGLLAPAAPGDLEQRVRASIEQRLPGGGPGVAEVARALHMSERTLRRRLQDAGLSFRALVDDVRHRLALEKLREVNLSTAEVAEALGFTTAQAFHRAFRRWTGSTVQAHRARERS